MFNSRCLLLISLDKSWLQPVKQVADHRQSVVIIRCSSRGLARGLRSFSWCLIFIDVRLGAGLLVHNQVFFHRQQRSRDQSQSGLFSTVRAVCLVQPELSGVIRLTVHCCSTAAIPCLLYTSPSPRD